MPCQPPIRTVAALPARVPTGWPQQVAADPVRAAGVPPNSTLALPWVTTACCMAGTKNGSAGARPTCGGVLYPVADTTTAGVPLISTVGHTPTVIGAANGSGGAGCGTPVAGFGIR